MYDQAQSLRDIVKKSDHEVLEAVKAERPQPLTKIITITSGKGGVGKSSVTVNLALALSQMGLRILIIDADFGLANIDVMLGMPSRYNLSHLLKKERALHEIVQQWHDSIYYISGGSGIRELLHMNEAQVAKIIDGALDLPEPVDIILCDTGAGVNDMIISLAAASTEVLLVTTPEPTAILDAYALLKTLYQEDEAPQAWLIMNKAVSAKEAENAIVSFVRITDKYLNQQIEPIGSILYDDDMAKSIKQQTPLMLSQPKSITARNFLSIAQALLQKPAEQKTVGPLAKLFSRWISVHKH